MGLEIVEDRASKQPFAPEKSIALRTKLAAFEAGLICYPVGGTRDGKRGDHILLAPPFIIEESQIEELSEKLALALSKVLEES